MNPTLHVRHTAQYKNHAKLHQAIPSYEALHSGARLRYRGRALDKALDTWYNTGVGLKEYMNRQQLQHTGAKRMITIKMKPNDSMERAMTKLKNIVIKEGLYKELKDRRYYAKPSRKRKLKREEAARQRVKDLHKDIRAALKDEENFLQ